MRSPRGTPAAEEHIEPDDEVDQADHAQPELEAVIHRVGNHFDGSFEGYTVARNGVVDLSVRPRGVEGALQIGDQCYRPYIGGGRFTDPCQQVPDLNSRTLTGLIRQNLFGLE